jgi:hypothetical protein
MKSKVLFVGLVLGFFLSAGIIQGQESRAILAGTVTDPQGKAVPGARVEVKNLATNVVNTVATSERGLYSVPPINPGQYSVTVSAPGFKSTVQGNVELRVGDRKQLDVRLELGTPTETITVSAEAVLLDTSSASVGTVIGREAIANLPMMGRNPFTLAQYAAGVNFTPGRTSSGARPFDNGGMDSFSINGGVNRQTEYLIDGSPNTNNADTGSGTYITFVPPPDAVSEFRVQSNLYDSEYGRTGGGVISLNLKSGTNAYHGSVYWYFRNDFLNANEIAANAAGTPLSAFRWNQPGAQLDGPVRIPGIYNGKDKTFFMYSYEAIRSSIPRVSSMTMPTAKQRAGDFSETYVSGTSGAVVQIYDPLTTVQTSPGVYTRTAFTGSIIPPNRINPIAKKLLEYYPMPDKVVARGTANLVVAPNATTDAYYVNTIRFDQIVNNQNKLFVSFMISDRDEDGGLGGGRAAFIAIGKPDAAPTYSHWRTNYGATVNLTSTLSPTFVSTARIAWNEHNLGIKTYAMGFDPATLGFPASFANQAQFKTFPQISTGSMSAIGNSRTSLDNFSDTWSVGETLSKVMSNHSLKFGGELRLMLNNLTTANASGNLTFSDAFTRANPLVSSSTSGDGFASFLLGYPSSVRSDYSNKPALGQRYYSFFVQDDWRLTNRLTLNLGLRWDYESPITDRFDRQIIGFDDSTTSALGSTTIKGGLLFADQNNRFAFKRDLNNWQPRIGIAYKVSSKLVVRGGWGLSYMSGSGDIPPTDGFSTTTQPSTSEGGAGIVPLLNSVGCVGADCGMLTNPFPTGINLPPGSAQGLKTSVGLGISYFWNDRAIPYVHSFSAGFQYELPFRTVVDFSYIGSRSRALSTSKAINGINYQQYMANGSTLTTTVTNPYAGLLPGTTLNGATITKEQSLRPYTQYTGITQNGRTIGSSRYDALQVRMEKRFSKGLSALFTGTWAWDSTLNSYLNGGMDDFGQFIRRIGATPPQVLNLSGTYALPFFKSSAPVLRSFLGGWMVAGTATWQTGGLLAATAANTTGLDPRISDPTQLHRFNTCTYNDNTGLRQNCTSTTEPVAWIIRKPYVLLTTPEPQFNDWRAPFPLSINLSLFKAFRLRESARLEIRAEAFNFTNTPRINNPQMSATSSQFGQIATIGQANDPRQVQIGLRLTF